MATTLDQYLEGKTPKGFRAVPHYFEDGDYVSFYFSDGRCYAKRVDELLTAYYSEETGELVGCKIKGVALLLRTLKEDFAVVVGAVAAGLDMATWARPILQAAARQEIAKTGT